MVAHQTTRPQGELALQLAELLTRTSWRLRRGAVKELAPLGLTFAQGRALRVLAAYDEGVRIGEFAARLEIVPRSATSMIDGLEAADLVARRADPGDRRSTIVCLTDDGRALLERLREARRAGAEALLGHLEPYDRNELLRLLTILDEQGAGCAVEGSEPISPRPVGGA